MSNPKIEGLSLHEEGEEEGFCFDVKDDGRGVDLQWRLVGRFLCDRLIHVKSMKSRITGYLATGERCHNQGS